MRNYTRFEIVLGIFLTLSFSNARALAATAADFTQSYTLKTVPLGFGGAYRALADSNSAILVNPAGLAQRRGLVMAGGDYVSSGFMDGTVISASVVDFKATDALALGIEYDRSTFTPSLGNKVTLNQMTLGAATSLGDMLFIGANLKGYLSGIDSKFQSAPDGVDMGFGFLVKPVEMVSLALTVDNVFLGNGREEFPLEMGFGAGLTLAPNARIDVDLTRNFKTSSPNKINAYFGGELRAAEGMFLRGGFALDKVTDNNFYSLGAVIAGPSISMNFTFSERLNPGSETYGGNIEFSF